MKIFKRMLMWILAALALVLMYGVLAEKKYSLSSEVVINKPKSEVFEYARHIKNQEKWSKWVMEDPNIKIEYNGTDGEVGFKSSWTSEVKNVGVGEQEIMQIDGNNRLDVEIRFQKPFKGISQAFYTVDSIGVNQSKVTTTFNSESPFPMNLIIPIIKNMLKKDMDQNSANLKAVLEK